jgi:hypothetical protein
VRIRHAGRQRKLRSKKTQSTAAPQRQVSLIPQFVQPLAQRDFDHLVSLRSLRQSAVRRGIWQAFSEAETEPIFRSTPEVDVKFKLIGVMQNLLKVGAGRVGQGGESIGYRLLAELIRESIIWALQISDAWGGTRLCAGLV